MSSDTLILLLAFERGKGPTPLTEHRPKAAVPFGGKFRLIDFPLTNCLHSDMRRILVLTQYRSHSLQTHLRDGWSIFNPELDEFILPVPPQMRAGQEWYSGPFDAIRQNRYLIERSPVQTVLVLDAGAVYRMDYAEMVRAHMENGAQISVAVREVTPSASTGTQAQVHCDEAERIQAFEPTASADSVESAAEDEAERMETMGVYLFDKRCLLDALDRFEDVRSGENDVPDQDLALDVISHLTDSCRVHAYRFGQTRGRVTPDRYWCDLSSVDAYYQANMALLLREPPVDLYQSNWNIRTMQRQFPPARTIPGAESGNEGIFVNSMLSSGTVISGGGVNHSILFHRVTVNDGAIVEDCILFDEVRVGAGAHLHHCIIDKGVEVPAGVQVGIDSRVDHQRFPVSEQGIVVIPKGYRW